MKPSEKLGLKVAMMVAPIVFEGLVPALAHASPSSKIVLEFTVAAVRNVATDSNLSREYVLDMYREIRPSHWEFVGLVAPCYREAGSACRSPFISSGGPLPALAANEQRGRPYWRFVFDSLPPGRYAFSGQQHFRPPQVPLMKSKVFTIRSQ